MSSNRARIFLLNGLSFDVEGPPPEGWTQWLAQLQGGNSETLVVMGDVAVRSGAIACVVRGDTLASMEAGASLLSMPIMRGREN